MHISVYIYICMYVCMYAYLFKWICACIFFGSFSGLGPGLSGLGTLNQQPNAQMVGPSSFVFGGAQDFLGTWALRGSYIVCESANCISVAQFGCVEVTGLGHEGLNPKPTAERYLLLYFRCADTSGQRRGMS